MGESTTNKVMMAIVASNIRGIVQLANDLNIQREDIVSLNKEGTEYILVYYGED